LRIAIPLDETKEVACTTFGCEIYFLLYDSQSKTNKIRVNATVVTEGGSSLKAAQLVVDM